MTCRGFIKVLLKIINFLFILVGLAMVGYGVYMFVIWSSQSSSTTPSPPPPPSTVAVSTSALSPIKNSNTGDTIPILQLRRSLLQTLPIFELTSSGSFWRHIPSAWFLYVFIAVGIVITLITCFGYIAAATTNGCCLSCFSLFLGLLMILELAFVGFVFFDQNWQEVIPEDSTGELDTIENFIEDKIEIFKWVALGVIVLQAFVLLLAVILRAMGRNLAEVYDSDDEILARTASRQPLLNTSTQPGASAAGAEYRPARNDAWSTRMREKYGLDTAEFSYNPSNASRFSQQQPITAQEKKSLCVIM